MQRKGLLNSLFEMWDNDGSGFLDIDDVQTVMLKYKDGLEKEAISAGERLRILDPTILLDWLMSELRHLGASKYS